MVHQYRLTLQRILVFVFALCAFGNFANATECKNQGDLDTRYCDDNGDLVADTPGDAGELLASVPTLTGHS